MTYYTRNEFVTNYVARTNIPREKVEVITDQLISQIAKRNTDINITAGEYSFAITVSPNEVTRRFGKIHLSETLLDRVIKLRNSVVDAASSEIVTKGTLGIFKLSAPVTPTAKPEHPSIFRRIFSPR